MAMHQSSNSIGVKIYNGYWYKGYPWHTHLHKSFEFVYIQEGVLSSTIGKKKYEIEAGKSAIIMPYEPHSFEADENTLYFVAVFSSDLCESFFNFTKSYEREAPIFSLRDSTVSY